MMRIENEHTRGYGHPETNTVNKWSSSAPNNPEPHSDGIWRGELRPVPSDSRGAERKGMTLQEWGEYLDSAEAVFDENVFNIVDELAGLLIQKQADYGPYNIASAPGGAMNGLLVRMHDKLARIVNLTKYNKTPQNEPLQDSFMDLANYCIIAIMVMRNQWEGATYPEGGTK